MAQPSKPASRASQGDKAEAAMRVDAAMVSELAKLLTENGLTEIEVVDGDRTVRVARNHGVAFAAPAASVPPMVAPAAAAPAPAAALAAEEISGETVKSPMVGTAFLSPEPGGKPFVAVGDAVKAGDTLLIIEAMKVMNPITAPSGGAVKKIMVADAQPVEFDQPLVIVG